MDEHYKSAFVILHYMNINDTEECIQSILINLTDENYAIIIVDNASENNTGSILKERYKFVNNIFLLSAACNLGFAQGNNMGFKYAKNILQAKFIIAINNDIILQQHNFLEKIYKIYDKEKFSILGPDITDMFNRHQNPHRTCLLSLKEVKKKIRNRTIILCYLKLKKWLHLEGKMLIIEKIEYKHGLQERENINTKEKQESVILHGSCIIFSPLYIDVNFDAFYPQTFLYCEEEILAYLCLKRKQKILYSPEIKVLHKTQSSTKYMMEDFERQIFNATHLLKSEKILLKLMKMKE